MNCAANTRDYVIIAGQFMSGLFHMITVDYLQRFPDSVRTADVKLLACLM
jgi:hypothetical protein